MIEEERPSRNDLAAQRTIMAAERTLMAWTRTSLSLVTFGFTIYKFLQYLYRQEHVRPEELKGPRYLGLTLIGLGVVFLLLASVQFRHDLRIIMPDRRISMWRLPFILAIIMVLLGVVAFIQVAF